MYWIVYICIAIVVAILFSKGSAMSKGWTAFFSICFTPFVALLGIFLIGKYGNSRKKPFNESGLQKTICVISAIVAIYLVYALYIGYPRIPSYTKQYLSENDYENIMENLPTYKLKLRSFYIVLLITIGFLGNIIYVVSNADTYIKEQEIDFDFEKKETV